jgi:serine/threonine protein phosphatase PrpC
MGSIASQVAAKVVANRVAQPGQLELIASDPVHQMQLLFDEAHVAIEDAFKEYYKDQGWVVDKNVEGYLVKRRKDGSADYCIHGGSTGTVVVVVDGHKLIVGNVGDSSAITDMSLPECHSKRWSVSSPSASSFDLLLHPPSPPGLGRGLGLGTTTSSTAAISGNTGTVSANSSVPTSPVPMHYQHLTIDHSPDDINEFERVLKFRPSSRRKGFPEVLFVYDALSSSKHACPDIYNMKSDGSVVVTNKGKYYKNVRSEWASLITTPPYSRFQDALAFTRSLGDFHLHTYGVSHEPAVQCYDLFDIPQGSTTSHTMIVASDGIWDNWKYEDAIQYCTDSRRVEQVVSSRDATVATKAFMNQNIM